MNFTEQFIRRKLSQGAYRLGDAALPHERQAGFALTSRNGFGAGAARRRTTVGPNVWYDTTTDTPNTSITLGAGYFEWDYVTVAQAGTATKVRIKMLSQALDRLTGLAVYNSSGTLLGSQTFTVPSTVSDAWVEATLSTQFSVSAGTYYIGSNANGALNAVRAVNTKPGRTPYVAQTWANFPAATLPTQSGTEDKLVCYGIFVA